MSEKTEKLLEKSIKNLRDNLSEDISMDTFVKSTIETLMTIERDEYLEKAENPNEKGNGHYARAMHSLSKNALMVHIPRTRAGLLGPSQKVCLRIFYY